MTDAPNTPAKDGQTVPAPRPKRSRTKRSPATFARAAHGLPTEPPAALRKRGRPPVPDAEARSKRITIRLEPDEAARLAGLAARAGLTESEFIRRAIKGARVSATTKTPEADFALVRELVAQGNNLNQIARAVNRTRGVPAGTADALDKINALLDRLLQQRGTA